MAPWFEHAPPPDSLAENVILQLTYVRYVKVESWGIVNIEQYLENEVSMMGSVAL